MVVPRCRSPWGNGACSYRGGIFAVPSRRPPHPSEKKGRKNIKVQPAPCGSEIALRLEDGLVCLSWGPFTGGTCTKEGNT